jgi:hypothetical protein
MPGYDMGALLSHVKADHLIAVAEKVSVWLAFFSAV